MVRVLTWARLLVVFVVLGVGVLGCINESSSWGFQTLGYAGCPGILGPPRALNDAPDVALRLRLLVKLEYAVLVEFHFLRLVIRAGSIRVAPFSADGLGQYREALPGVCWVVARRGGQHDRLMRYDVRSNIRS